MTTDEAILTEFEKKWEFSDEVGSFQTYRLVDKEKVIAWLRSVLSRIRSHAEADGARKEREKWAEFHEKCSCSKPYPNPEHGDTCLNCGGLT